MIAVDHNNFFFSISFFNASKDFLETIKFGVSNLVVVEPFYVKVKFPIENKENPNKVLEYSTIQCSNLTKILIDNKSVTSFGSSPLFSSKFFN